MHNYCLTLQALLMGITCHTELGIKHLLYTKFKDDCATNPVTYIDYSQNITPDGIYDYESITEKANTVFHCQVGCKEFTDTILYIFGMLKGFLISNLSLNIFIGS